MRGVYYKNMKWQAAIKVDKKQIHLGTVGSQEEAARLYDRYNAYLNDSINHLLQVFMFCFTHNRGQVCIYLTLRGPHFRWDVPGSFVVYLLDVFGTWVSFCFCGLCRAAFMCGREPNFELTVEEKDELSKLSWDEFLTMTRSAINSKSIFYSPPLCIFPSDRLIWTVLYFIFQAKKHLFWQNAKRNTSLHDGVFFASCRTSFNFKN